MNESKICDVNHFFCECFRVEKLWGKMIALIGILLGYSDMCSSQPIRLNFPFSRYPGAAWLLGAYIEKVWNAREEVTVCEDELFGFLRFKFKHRKL